MRYYKIVSVSTIVLSLVLGGCSGLTTRQKNTAAGAAIGGVAGAVLTGGSSFGTVGGACHRRHHWSRSRWIEQ